MCWVLANPSKASALRTDPTVARCLAYSRTWGYGRAAVVNCRAWRATDPREVPADPIAIGPENDRHIVEVAQSADLVVCGWGALGGARGQSVLALLRSAGVALHALAFTRSGQPRHPLYLPAALVPVPM